MTQRSTAHGDEESLPRFVVGIDLGTTNCAMSYVDTERSATEIESFSVRQWFDLHTVDEQSTLPSFAYQPTTAEQEARESQLPWEQPRAPWLVGVAARELGSRAPGRLVVSAKSWLCHGGVDRTVDLLPWQASEDVDRVSPIDASAMYLRHLRGAWDAAHPEFPLAEQDVVLTIPASFDEVAREFTVQAARKAGLPRVVLIEEPQAAFYAWLARHRDDWETLVSPGEIILVCDIGGGTSDFTLIQVRRDDSLEGKIRFHRLAVGDHLILGGDNLDLSLAYFAEQQMQAAGETLGPRDWDRLIRQARLVKESALSGAEADELTIRLAGAGSRLVQGGKQVRLAGDQVRDFLLTGFFPDVTLSAPLEEESAGFTEFGLPYAADPAITRHLASFLREHAEPSAVIANQDKPSEGDSTAANPASATDASRVASHEARRPDVVLFNGGMFESPIVRERVLDQLAQWFQSSGESDWRPRCLDHDRLDLAVSRGAATFGMVRRGVGTRISAGLARSYYVGVAGDGPEAVCLLPAGIEPGEEVRLQEPQFELQVATPIQLPIFASSVRLNDPPGQRIPVDSEQLKSLPPIRTVIENKRQQAAESLPVELHAELTEVGTMHLFCQELAGERRWRLQFDVRSATATDATSEASVGEAAGVLDESLWEACEAELILTFREKQENPDAVMPRLAEILGEPREAWRPTLLRRLWEVLLAEETGRQLSSRHEARWLNMCGYFLRPGYGMAMDDWRVSTTWKVVQGKLFHGHARGRVESWILWRRIAGGLTTGQQQTLAAPLLNAVRQTHRQTMTGRGKGSQVEFGSHEAAEVWRLLGSLEKLPRSHKEELGELILDLLPKRRFQPSRAGMLWALGRLGSRRPVYGLLNDVLPAEAASRWAQRLMETGGETAMDCLAVMQLTRRCHDRYRDIDADTRERVIAWLDRIQGTARLRELVSAGGELDSEQQSQVLGDALPVGLRVRPS